ncbi:hypothetical protein NQZ68_036288 [Dissostichus eleginoides]|nr:hypothetical protein NQZ68_036288 [Dissostichus eleginoides]
MALPGEAWGDNHPLKNGPLMLIESLLMTHTSAKSMEEEVRLRGCCQKLHQSSLLRVQEAGFNSSLCLPRPSKHVSLVTNRRLLNPSERVKQPVRLESYSIAEDVRSQKPEQKRKVNLLPWFKCQHYKGQAIKATVDRVMGEDRKTLAKVTEDGKRDGKKRMIVT